MTDPALRLLAMLDPQRVEVWLQTGGYFALFGVLFMCGIGLPMPEDIPLIATGALIAHGHMALLPAAVAAWCGIIGGDLILYHLGKRFGRNITRVPVVGKHIDVSRIEKIERLFDKYGIWVIAVGRLFAGVRGVVVITAGTIRFPLAKFLLADGLAALVSGGLFMLLGYWFGQNLPALMEHVRQGKWGAFVLLAGIILAVAAVWYVRKRRARPVPSASA